METKDDNLKLSYTSVEFRRVRKRKSTPAKVREWYTASHMCHILATNLEPGHMWVRRAWNNNSHHYQHHAAWYGVLYTYPTESTFIYPGAAAYGGHFDTVSSLTARKTMSDTYDFWPSTFVFFFCIRSLCKAHFMKIRVTGMLHAFVGSSLVLNFCFNAERHAAPIVWREIKKCCLADHFQIRSQNWFSPRN